MKEEKCLFLKNHPCEKEICEICPVYYDWAVYEIYKKETKKELYCHNLEDTCVKGKYICWDCEFETYFPYYFSTKK
ncbi:MAG: hypothetical protein QXD95_02765 [Nitrososphaeria archaeon]